MSITDKILIYSISEQNTVFWQLFQTGKASTSKENMSNNTNNFIFFSAQAKRKRRERWSNTKEEKEKARTYSIEEQN